MNDSVVKEDKYENYLLVEGSEDKHVLRHLLGYHQIPQQFKIKDEHFEIKDHEGIDNLLNQKTLRTYLKIDEMRRFGIIVDADTNLTARWQKVRDILNSLGYNTLPISLNFDGLILKEEGRPVVGIWLMPNNQISGVLEDFVRFLVPSDDVLWPKAKNIVEEVKAIETDRRFHDVYESKACIHTWLAWQKEPGKPMGVAITARYLDATNPQAQQLITWIRQLFNLESV